MTYDSGCWFHDKFLMNYNWQCPFIISQTKYWNFFFFLMKWMNPFSLVKKGGDKLYKQCTFSFLSKEIKNIFGLKNKGFPCNFSYEWNNRIVIFNDRKQPHILCHEHTMCLVITVRTSTRCMLLSTARYRLGASRYVLVYMLHHVVQSV